MDGSKWTPQLVADRLEEAASTLRRLPMVGLNPREYGNAWPAIVYDANEAYGWNNAELRLGPPSGEAITRMDEAMEWLRWLEPEDVKLVWMRATRIPWKIIQQKIGVARSTAASRRTAAILQIVAILNLRKRKMSRHFSSGHLGQNLT